MDNSTVRAQRVRRERWKRQVGASLGGAGFVMSLGLTLAAIYADLRGSDIAARPLDQILIYRDGEGDRSVLSVASKVVLVNAASSDHGDMLLGARLELDGLRFRLGGSLDPNFTADPAASGKCPIDARCVVRRGLVAVEKGDEVLDVPGGSHLLTHLAFPLVGWNCEGDKVRCASLATASGSLALLGKARSLVLVLDFHGDGERRLDCQIGKIDQPYLQRVGWTAVGCADANVHGGPLI